MLPFETGALTSALQDLDVKPEVINQIVSTLTSTSDDMGDGTFKTLAAIGQQEFGARDTAHELAVHHEKAHAVMQQAIDGIAKDLADFAAGAKTAIAYIDNADADSAASLRAQQAVLELNDVAHHSQGNYGYDHGRNHQDQPATSGSPDQTSGS